MADCPSCGWPGERLTDFAVYAPGRQDWLCVNPEGCLGKSPFFWAVSKPGPEERDATSAGSSVEVKAT